MDAHGKHLAGARSIARTCARKRKKREREDGSWWESMEPIGSVSTLVREVLDRSEIHGDVDEAEEFETRGKVMDISKFVLSSTIQLEDNEFEMFRTIITTTLRREKGYGTC